MRVVLGFVAGVLAGYLAGVLLFITLTHCLFWLDLGKVMPKGNLPMLPLMLLSGIAGAWLVTRPGNSPPPEPPE
jgi:hypothetical protein